MENVNLDVRDRQRAHDESKFLDDLGDDSQPIVVQYFFVFHYSEVLSRLFFNQYSSPLSPLLC